MKKYKKIPWRFVVIGLLSLMLGLFYYLLFRDPASLYLWRFPGIPWLAQLISDINPVNFFSGYGSGFDSLPSFLHVLAMSYLSIGIIKLGRHVVFIIPIFWLLVNLLFEFGQRDPNEVLFFIPEGEGFFLLHYYFLNGVFDWNDIIASILAFSIIFLHLIIKMKYFISWNISFFKHPILTYIAGSCVFVIGIGSLMGTSVECRSDRCIEYESHDPIYLSYAELRRPVETNNEQILEDMGKIYLYQRYLFINDRNKGVHVYDNQEAADPIHLGFISVPGSIDIAIKDGYLYLDSYIDLVVVDISDIQNIREVHRIEEVFPYDPYQNIPEGIYLSHYDVKKGVVIGYKGRSNEN